MMKWLLSLERMFARGSGANAFDNVEIHQNGSTINMEEERDGHNKFIQKMTSNRLNYAVGINKKLKKIFKSKINVNVLYQEVVKTKWFEDQFLYRTCDHFVKGKNLAKRFLAKSNKLKRIWLRTFKGYN